MIKKIAKMALIVVAVVFTVAAAAAQTQTDTNCTTSPDYGVGSTTRCTSMSTPPPPPPTPIISPQDSARFGNALGVMMAQSRAKHQQEKNDLTAVVFCRQNPLGSWTFPGKAPMACATLEKNVVAYCTVNPKTATCKHIAKLPPPALTPVAATAPQVQPQQAPVTTQPVQNVVVSQPQPQLQTVNAKAVLQTTPATPAPVAKETIHDVVLPPVQEESLGDRARRYRQHAACLKLAADNPSIMCK